MTVVRARDVRVSRLSWLCEFFCNYFVAAGVHRTLLRLASVLCCLLLSDVPAFSQTVVDKVPVGTGPNSVAINPLTNKIYVTNQLGNNVTEIDGATDVTTTIPLHPSSTPMALAVNSLTNKIFVACQFGNSFAGEIAVIDANNNNAVTFTSLPPFPNPFAIAVDPVKNLVFVLNQQFGITVSVFDANMFLKQTITLGNVSGGQAQISAPAIAVDSQHAKVYVTGVIGSFGEGVSIIDENHLANAPLVVGVFAPGPIVVDEVTNKILVLAFGQNNGLNFPEVVVIDGGNCQTTNPELPNCPSTPIPLGSFGPLVLNPATHKAYAGSGAGVTVIDTSQPGYPTTSVSVPSTNVQGLAVNPLTNKIYASTGSTSGVAGSIFVIDGTNDTLLPGSAVLPGPSFVRALNPITNRIYAADVNNKQIAVIDGATNSLTGVTDLNSAGPSAVAVNPITHKAYVANTGIDSRFTGNTNPIASITVIDPTKNNAIKTIVDPNAIDPAAIAVDPLTNTVYVANRGSNNVTVIDGNADSYITTITDPLASSPIAVAVNVATNEVYVANNGSGNVSVIDIKTETVIHTLSAGPAPFALAVNNFESELTPGLIRHQVYVANNVPTGTVTIIDGDQVVFTENVGGFPFALTVSPQNHLVWVADDGTNDVGVFDPEAFSPVLIPLTGTHPRSIDINFATNKVYVGDQGTGNVDVIDANTRPLKVVTSVNVGGAPFAIVANSNTNRVYVARLGADDISVIDGAGNTSTLLKDPLAFGPIAIAVDPTLNQAFVANSDLDDRNAVGSDTATIINEQGMQAVPLQTTITPFANNLTTSLTPTFDLNATSTFSPTAPSIDNLFYQFDSWEGPWMPASNLTGGAFNVTPTLTEGLHILYAFATDSRELSSGIDIGAQTISPFVGSIAAYPFVAGGISIFPQITSISPTSGIIGTQITINGSNFGFSQDSSTVTIGGVNAGTAISWGDNQIMIDVPFGADIASTSAPVIVTVNGDASNSVIFTILQEADLAITGSAAPNPVNTGGNLTYTFNLQNLGPNYATSVVFTDALPPTVTFVSANLAPSILGSCLQSSGTVTCNLQLAGGIGNAAVTIVVTPTAAGTLVNTATVSSNLTDPNPANNTAVVTTTVNAAPQVTVIVMTSPSGPTFTVDNTTYSSPQTFTWFQGSTHSIGTTSPQTSSTGTLFNFANWSDGGAQTHSVTAPTSPTTYTAGFNVAIPVTNQVSEIASGLLFNRITHEFSGTLTITNNGAAISGPIEVLFQNLTPGVTLVNAAGSYQGIPFLSIANGLAPGQSVQLLVVFQDPSLARLNFNIAIYSGVL